MSETEVKNRMLNSLFVRTVGLSASRLEGNCQSFTEQYVLHTVVSLVRRHFYDLLRTTIISMQTRATSLKRAKVIEKGQHQSFSLPLLQ